MSNNVRRNDIPVLTQEQAEALEARLIAIDSSGGVEKYDMVEDAEFNDFYDLLYAEFPDGRFWIFYF